MSKYINTNDLTSHVHDHCDITIVLFPKSLIFKVLMCMCHRDAVIATVLQILIQELYNSFDVI